MINNNECHMRAELPLSEDGRVYHLFLQPDMMCRNIILVGDPQRARKVSNYFDEIESHTVHREFSIFKGNVKGTDIMVIGTGMGTENIEITLTDAEDTALKKSAAAVAELKAFLTTLD